jgi:hypothetical protein
MPTIIDVLLEADPGNLEVMRQRVEALASREDPKSGVESFVRLKQIPGLHFMSMQIFEDSHFDPLLVFENNFDGDPRTHWQSVLKYLSDDLRAIFACTKHAKLPAWHQLFEPGDQSSLVGFIEAHSCVPSAQHFGAVANSLKRINRDRGVFNNLQNELGATASEYRTLSEPQVQNALHRWAVAKYPWMNQPESPTAEQEIRTYKWSAWKPVLPWLISFIVGLPVFLWLCLSDYLSRQGYTDVRFALRSLLIVSFVVLVCSVAMFWRTLRLAEG